MHWTTDAVEQRNKDEKEFPKRKEGVRQLRG